MKANRPINQSEAHFFGFLWLVPAVIIIVGSFFSYANVDSTRDYIEAYRIATGQNMPLLGPQMAFSFSVGPWWFYLLSVVLLFEKSWLLIAVLTAILTAIKYYLAFQVGRMVADKTLGLLMVICLLMVSLTWMQSITFTHTNLIETAILLIIFLALKDQHNRVGMWFIYGLLCALAFHVHPTAFLAGYFILIKWLGQTAKLRNAIAFMLGMLLIFLPLIFSELIAEKTLAQGAANYIEQHTSTLNINDYFKLLSGLWVVAPFAMLKTLTVQNTAILVVVIQVLIQIIAMTSPLFFWQTISLKIRHFLRHLWVFFLLSCLGLILIRANTPWYMTYGISLVSSMITAIGLYILYTHGSFKKSVVVISGWIFTVFLVAQYTIINDLRNNEIVVPSATLNDIKSLNTDLSGFGYEILAHEASNHGAFTCQNKPLALHGPYSNLIYSHSGMEHMSECEGGLFYGPMSDVNHWVGVPPQFKKYIKLPPKYHIGNTYFYHPVDISTTQLGWAENFTHDYERKVQPNPNWQQKTVVTQLHGGSHLTLTNLLGFKMPLTVVKVQLNGTEIEPVKVHVYSSLYVCEACSPTDTVWDIEYQEGVTGMTNVISF